MASTIDRIKNDIIKALNASQKKTSTYDTEAEVVRVEGNTAWVHIGGGVPETPVQLTINAQKGDKVQVRVSNEGAWIMGNATAPPTDDTKAEEAKQEIAETNVVVKLVKTIAEQAQKIAGNTNQYFWHTQEGTDTGAHITEIPQAEFLADPSNGGGNLLARSNGIAVRDGLTELAVFGASIARIGQEGSCIHIYPNQLEGQSDNVRLFEMSLSGSNTQIRKSITLGTYPKGAIQTITLDLSDYDAWTDISNGETFYISKRAPSDTSWYNDTFTRGTGSTGQHNNVVYDGLNTITFTTYRYSELIIGMDYYTETKSPVYVFGTLDDDTTLGAYSFSSGFRNVIRGDYSHAEGRDNYAYGVSSHVEGDANEANGYASHAEGFFTEANEYASHAQNYNTKASSEYQTALGKYNIEDSNKVYAVIVGNGTSNARSNALTVEWNGNTAIAGTLTQGSDRRLKDHISYLGDDAVDFIRQLKPAHYRKDDADHVGFYAQDVESADKWNCMVGEMNGFKTLGYTELIAPLVAYCQSLEKRIEELEGK